MKNIIKKLRMKNGITQSELARMIGISRPALSNIETGKVIPQGNTMIKISKVLGINIEQIFFEDSVIQVLQEPATCKN